MVNIKKEEYRAFLQSGVWKDKRRKLIRERGCICQNCNKEVEKWKLYLHHMNYDFEFGMEMDDDLLLLCENCHNETEQDLEFFEKKENINQHICPECNNEMFKTKEKRICFKCNIEVSKGNQGVKK